MYMQYRALRNVFNRIDKEATAMESTTDGDQQKELELSIRPISDIDREAVIDIFNYYVENLFAAYPECKLPYQAFDKYMEMSAGYPTGVVARPDGKVFGFGMLRGYNPIPVFSQSAEISYFFDIDYTGKGLGKILLGYLEEKGKAIGITSLLANMSSLNAGSINFHNMNGFKECGRFKRIGIKNGQIFDMVWMQKMI